MVDNVSNINPITLQPLSDDMSDAEFKKAAERAQDALLGPNNEMVEKYDVNGDGHISDNEADWNGGAKPDELEKDVRAFVELKPTAKNYEEKLRSLHKEIADDLDKNDDGHVSRSEANHFKDGKFKLGDVEKMALIIGGNDVGRHVYDLKNAGIGYSKQDDGLKPYTPEQSAPSGEDRGASGGPSEGGGPPGPKGPNPPGPGNTPGQFGQYYSEVGSGPQTPQTPGPHANGPDGVGDNITGGGKVTVQHKHYAPGPQGNMEIYKPENATKHTPMIYMFHGGGFTGGDKSERSADSRKLAEQGYIVVNINYPTNNNLPDMVRAGADAIATARKMLGGDHPSFTMGHSAGAPIGANLANDPSQDIDGFIGFSGVYNQGAAYGENGPYGSDDPNDPPSLLFSGELDYTYKNESPLYAQDIRQAGGTVTSVRVPGADHNTVIVNGIQYNYDNILSRIEDFIGKYS